MTSTDTALTELTERIRAAQAERRPLRIRAGGSKDFYGQSLQGELLDVRPLRGIVSYEPSELVVTVRAGTPLTELEAALAERGQCLAFEPPMFSHASDSTCGGVVAAGLSGPARASAGAVRDFVLGVSLINGRAELLRFGGQVIKNVAGYDVSRLMVGALGTLGVLTEISLKVLPVAPLEATLEFELEQGAALTELHRWGGQALPLSASCWWQDPSDASRPARLLLRLRGAAAAVEAACRSMTQQLAGHRLEPDQAAAHWQACRDQRLSFFTHSAPELGLWRLSLPQTAPVLMLPWPQLIEWHGGQRWVRAPASAQTELRHAAAQHGGSATLFRMPEAGSTSPVARFHPLSPALARIHQQLKAEFDPAGIFNPGRLYGEW